MWKGPATRYTLRRNTASIMKILILLQISLFSVLVSFVALMTLSVILFGTSLFRAISGPSYAIAVIMPLIGYGSGYLLATGFGLPDASKRTVGKKIALL